MRRQVPGGFISTWAGRCWFGSAQGGSGKIVRSQRHQVRLSGQGESSSNQAQGVTDEPSLPMDDRAALLNAYLVVDDAAKKRLRTITKQITRLRTNFAKRRAGMNRGYDPRRYCQLNFFS